MRFGLVGTGRWARDTHGAGLNAASGAELVGVWGRDPSRSAETAGALGVLPYPDLEALLGDVEAVSFAVPPDVQAALAVRAARAGRHLLLDKPVALDLAAADAVVAAAAAAGVASAVFFTSRYREDVEGQLQAARARGGWEGAQLTVFSAVLAPENPRTDSPWRTERGAVWDVGPHALGGLLAVLAPVVRVSALPGRRAATHAVLEHADGAVSTMSLTLEAPDAARRWETQLYGAAGWRQLPRGDGPAHQAFTRAAEELTEAARTGVAHRCDVRFGRDVVAVLEAVDTAVREQRVVEVRPASGPDRR